MSIFEGFFKRLGHDVEKELLKKETESQKLDLELIRSVSDDVFSTLDINTLLQESIDKVVVRYKFLGGILLLVKDNRLYAQTISRSKASSLFLKLIGTPISTLSIDITKNSGNLIIESVVKKRYFVSNNLEKYTKGVLGYKVSIAAQRITGTKSCISIPILHKKEVLGVIFLTQNHKTDFVEELKVLQLVVNQLGIALTNALLYQKEKEQVEILKEKNIQLNAIRTRERDMMDIMGHELRTPLSIIRLSIGILEQRLKESKAITNYEKYIDRTKEALDREIRLLEDMLSSTKLEAERIELHMEKVDINNIIDNTYLAMVNKAKSKGIKLVVSKTKEDVFVYADRVRIAEVIDNLVSNAIKYTPQGEVVITSNKQNDSIKITVSDTGIGIPKEDIPHLGEKFYRVGQYSNNIIDRKHRESIENDPQSLVRPGGTGLGLYVSYNLVKLMNGEIEVKSKISNGTQFTITLPIYKKQPKIVPKKTKDKNIFERLGFTQS